MWLLRVLKFIICGAQLSCLCSLATCMMLLLGKSCSLKSFAPILQYYGLLLIEFSKYSPELSVYAYAAAQVKKTIEVSTFLLNYLLWHWGSGRGAYIWICLLCASLHRSMQYWRMHLCRIEFFFPFVFVGRSLIILVEKIMFSGVVERDIHPFWTQIWKESWTIW